MNAEDKLHSAICNAVILLNNGEEVAPRVSSILRTALAEYEPTPEATTAAGLVDGDDTLRLAYVLSHVRFDEDGAFIPLGANKITAANAVESLACIDAAIPAWRIGEAAIGREVTNS